MRLRIRVLNPMYAYRHTYASYIQTPEYNEYEGEIMDRKAFAWLKPDQFIMSTGDEDAPYRIIDKDRIICGWRIKSVRHSSDVLDHVSIPGKSGKSYIVSVGSRGDLRCNCLGFSYRRTCTHVSEVEEIAA